MAQFNIEFRIPNPITLEFSKKIPQQRLVLNEHLLEGKISSYYLSLEAGKLWVILNSENKLEAKEIIDKLPLTYLMNYQIFELDFYHSPAQIVPAFSLN